MLSFAPGSMAKRRLCGRQMLLAASAKVPATMTDEFAFACGSCICDARLDVDVREADAVRDGFLRPKKQRNICPNSRPRPRPILPTRGGAPDDAFVIRKTGGFRLGR